jgi:peptidoglycan/xylan/chitin deacetylase (PgdA/CDA1 family)
MPRRMAKSSSAGAHNMLPMHKRLVRLAVSSVVYLFSWTRSLLLRAVGVRPSVPSAIIYYHVVAPEHRGPFAAQLDALLRWAKLVRADVATPVDPSVRHVAVTFDDGSESVLTNALPELEKRGIPFTVFAIPGMLGQPVSWEPPPERLMSADELQTLSKSELVTIGSHTVSHPSLLTLTESSARAELRNSKLKLEALLQREVTLFCFPYGDSSTDLVEWCRQAGYERVFTTLPRNAFETPHEFVSGRVRVDPTDWPLEFYLKIAGAYRWLPPAIALKRKLRSAFGLERLPHRTIEAVANPDRT